MDFSVCQHYACWRNAILHFNVNLPIGYSFAAGNSRSVATASSLTNTHTEVEPLKSRKILTHKMYLHTHCGAAFIFHISILAGWYIRINFFWSIQGNLGQCSQQNYINYKVYNIRLKKEKELLHKYTQYRVIRTCQPLCLVDFEFSFGVSKTQLL